MDTLGDDPASTTAAAEIAAAINGLSPAELARLRALARARAQGLPAGMGWADLLQEAVTRTLAGNRKLPPDVPLVAFLGGVMRSLANEAWRRSRREGVLLEALGETAGEDAARDPERTALAIQALSSIHRLFAGDPDVLKLLAGLADELSGEEIRQMYDLPARDYESARKRLRRAALRWALRNDVP